MRPALVVLLLRRAVLVATCGSESVKRTSPPIVPVAALVSVAVPLP